MGRVVGDQLAGGREVARARRGWLCLAGRMTGREHKAAVAHDAGSFAEEGSVRKAAEGTGAGMRWRLARVWDAALEDEVGWWLEVRRG